MRSPHPILSARIFLPVAAGLATLAVFVSSPRPSGRGAAFGGAIAWAATPEEAEMARDEKIIGPEGSDNSCSNCHAHEVEAWKHTHHYTTFVQRHQSPEAKKVMANLGRTGINASMKRAEDCRHCHYTSTVVGGKITPRWGVSCESCHGAGKDWNNIHNKVGGDPAGRTLKWGEGQKEAPEARAKRLDAAVAKGMIDSAMVYEIAANCFGCHTVPNEELVNKGKHKAGSDFDLVAWSQGEVRHNYLSSPGSPEKPTNPPVSQEERRRLYVVGAMVDLEVTLRNLAGVKEKGGDFHKAMIERANRARKKVDAILKAVPVPELAAALKDVPASFDATTAVSSALPAKLGEATRQFARGKTDLAAVDGQIPTTFKGEATP